MALCLMLKCFIQKDTTYNHEVSANDLWYSALNEINILFNELKKDHLALEFMIF